MHIDIKEAKVWFHYILIISMAQVSTLFFYETPYSYIRSQILGN